MPCNFIFIDGSYFCFYRYYSTMAWWKNAFPDKPLEHPIANEIFVDKFKKTFIDNIKNISVKLNINQLDADAILIVDKDCKREDIWRNSLYPNYKSTRNNTDFKGGPFFKMVYDEDLFIKSGAKHIIYHNKLEADDVIAITTKYLLKTYDDCKIHIITSDKDYLQLVEPRVKIINLAFKDITELKSSNKNPECDLFCKIIMGDVSDNITSVFPKCGPKTALKYFNNKELFENNLIKFNLQKKYKLNKTLVDFNEIPQELVSEFIENNNQCLLFL